jgi:hypothetical protein
MNIAQLTIQGDPNVRIQTYILAYYFQQHQPYEVNISISVFSHCDVTYMWFFRMVVAQAVDKTLVSANALNFLQK